MQEMFEILLINNKLKFSYEPYEEEVLINMPYFEESDVVSFHMMEYTFNYN